MRFLLYKNLNTIKFENHEWFLLPSFSFSKEKRGLIHATHAGAACGSCGFGFFDVNNECFCCENGGSNGCCILESATGNLGRVDEYILYLSNETGSGDWSVVGFGNGNVNLNNIMESENYLDVAIKSIANYESNLNTAQKELILSADEITLDSVSSTGEIVLQMTHDGEVNSFSMVPDNLTYYIESETARFSVKEE